MRELAQVGVQQTEQLIDGGDLAASNGREQCSNARICHAGIRGKEIMVPLPAMWNVVGRLANDSVLASIAARLSQATAAHAREAPTPTAKMRKTTAPPAGGVSR
jgi:hypothetical protein